jgi:hypothetical protein
MVTAWTASSLRPKVTRMTGVRTETGRRRPRPSAGRPDRRSGS